MQPEAIKMFYLDLLLLAIYLNVFGLNGVIGGEIALLPSNNELDINSTSSDHIMFDKGEILSRNKRYLLFTGGGISKVSKSKSQTTTFMENRINVSSSDFFFFRLF